MFHTDTEDVPEGLVPMDLHFFFSRFWVSYRLEVRPTFFLNFLRGVLEEKKKKVLPFHISFPENPGFQGSVRKGIASFL